MIKKLFLWPNSRLLKALYIIILLFIFTCFLGIVSVKIGNKLQKSNPNQARIAYTLALPIFYQPEVVHFNLGQSLYYSGKYPQAQKEYERALTTVGLKNKNRCAVLIQLVNSQLRPLENDFTNGKIIDHKAEVNTAISLLTQCLEIDQNNKTAITNIAILLIALEGKDTSQATSDQTDSNGEEDKRIQDVKQVDAEAQKQQRDFNQQDTKSEADKMYDSTQPSW